MIPLITMGIPGSVVDAILIGALIIHNLEPGPLLFTTNPEIAYGVISAYLIGNIIMFGIMIFAVVYVAKVLYVPRAYLLAAILLFCVIGILSQLIWRSKNKLGSKLDLSMLDCQIAILENAIARFSVEKKIPEPLGTDHPTISPFGVFKTKNGAITLAAGNNKIFKKLCDAIECKKLNDDVLFSTNKKRNKNLKLLKIKIESKLKNKNSEFWIKKFRKSDIPCAPINTIKNIVDDPHLKERKMVLDYRNNKFNSFKVTGNPLKFNFFKEKKQPKKSPKLNENKDEILKFFGIS